MGCAAYAGNLDKKEFTEGMIKRIESFRPKLSSDDSVSVVECGQAIQKTQLDCYIENALKDQAAHNKLFKESTENISQDIKVGAADASLRIEIVGLPHSPVAKAELETSKVRFEIHPHAFDFSFLDERQVTEHEEITDLVLKEIQNL